jgi:hypothetical protein
MPPIFRPVATTVTALLGAGTAPGLQLKTTPVQVAGIDNTLFTAGINPTVIGSIQRPLITIVVSQDPPAGTEVPFGTPVNITLASLENIPLNALTESAGLTFANLGDFRTALGANSALLPSVSNAASFQALSPADQAAFTAFASQHGSADASSAFGAAKIVASL